MNLELETPEETVLRRLHERLTACRARFKPFNSPHEIYGVLAEEVAEFFDEVRKRESVPGRAGAMENELIDVACVALRAAIELEATQEWRQQ